MGSGETQTFVSSSLFLTSINIEQTEVEEQWIVAQTQWTYILQDTMPPQTSTPDTATKTKEISPQRRRLRRMTMFRSTVKALSVSPDNG